jgi:hypothetical protein
LHDLLFYPEHGDSTFLRNVGKQLPDYTASYTGRQDLLVVFKWGGVYISEAMRLTSQMTLFVSLAKTPANDT